MLILMLLAACHRTEPPSSKFFGNWVLKTRGQNLMVLSLRLDGSAMHGALKRPAHFQMDPDGGFADIGGGNIEHAVLSATPSGEQLLISVKGSEGIAHYLMKLNDADHAELRTTEMPEWMAPLRFEHAEGTTGLDVGTDWSEPKPTPEIAALQSRLKLMAAEDQRARAETPISAKKLRDVSRQHLPVLLRIYQNFGWPKQSMIGKDAANAFWLLVQHQDAGFQQKLLPDMERAMREGEASRQNYAFLYDRVMKGQGRPQRWGTQTSCVDNKAELDPVEDSANLDQRRRDLHLPPVEDYVRQLDETCRNFVQDIR